MFWKSKPPTLVVAISRLDVEVDADLQLPLESQEDFDQALRIVEFARRKSLPIKTLRVHLVRDGEAPQRLRWLLDIGRQRIDVELFCPDPIRIQRILARHRSSIRVFAAQ